MFIIQWQSFLILSHESGSLQSFKGQPVFRGKVVSLQIEKNIKLNLWLVKVVYLNVLLC